MEIGETTDVFGVECPIPNKALNWSVFHWVWRRLLLPSRISAGQWFSCLVYYRFISFRISLLWVWLYMTDCELVAHLVMYVQCNVLLRFLDLKAHLKCTWIRWEFLKPCPHDLHMIQLCRLLFSNHRSDDWDRHVPITFAFTFGIVVLSLPYTVHLGRSLFVSGSCCLTSFLICFLQSKCVQSLVELLICNGVDRFPFQLPSCCKAWLASSISWWAKFGRVHWNRLCTSNVTALGSLSANPLVVSPLCWVAICMLNHPLVTWSLLRLWPSSPLRVLHLISLSLSGVHRFLLRSLATKLFVDNIDIGLECFGMIFCSNMKVHFAPVNKSDPEKYVHRQDFD